MGFFKRRILLTKFCQCLSSGGEDIWAENQSFDGAISAAVFRGLNGVFDGLWQGKIGGFRKKAEAKKDE